MPYAHNVLFTSTNDGTASPAILGPTIAGGREIGFTKNVIAAQTNLLIAVAFAVSGLQSIALTSDQACTIKTNSSGSPQETITLTAGGVLVWQVGGGGVIPFAGDVTAFYITNTLALKLRAFILTT